ncbi:MAG: tetratricopeptide repeat protein [Oscillatoria sp. SIO1A7]|nr:tetratricopeptide repeat protein [Oscillatoria sp. SIO1A7]
MATNFNKLANLRWSQGKHKEAEDLYLQALQIKVKLPEQELEMAISLNNLAVLYYRQGRYEEAEPLYLQALQIRIKLLG